MLLHQGIPIHTPNLPVDTREIKIDCLVDINIDFTFVDILKINNGILSNVGM